MKNIVKSVLLMIIMAVVLLGLTGCGGNKLVATREVDDNGITGKYKETLEFKFKDDKIDKVDMTMEFDDKDTATAAASIFKLGFKDSDDVKVKQSGKKLKISMNAKAFSDEQGFDEEISKEDLEKQLEEEGYTIK